MQSDRKQVAEARAALVVNSAYRGILSGSISLASPDYAAILAAQQANKPLISSAADIQSPLLSCMGSRRLRTERSMVASGMSFYHHHAEPRKSITSDIKRYKMIVYVQETIDSSGHAAVSLIDARSNGRSHTSFGPTPLNTFVVAATFGNVSVKGAVIESDDYDKAKADYVFIKYLTEAEYLAARAAQEALHEKVQSGMLRYSLFGTAHPLSSFVRRPVINCVEAVAHIIKASYPEFKNTSIIPTRFAVDLENANFERRENKFKKDVAQSDVTVQIRRHMDDR